MTRRQNISLILGLAGMIAIAGERVASAQAPDYPEESEMPGQALTSKYGYGLSIGGGVEDFTSSNVRSVTGLGGNWDLRLDIGSLLPVSVEIAYLGSANSIDSLFTRNSGTLIGTGVEGAIKGTLPTGTLLVPFAFGGLGWRNYRVTSADFNLIDDGINDDDNVIEFPIGAGLAAHYEGFNADLRFTYRPTISNNLVVDNADVLDPSFASMNTWSVSARVGINI